MCMAGHRNVEEEKRIFRHELIQHAKETYVRFIFGSIAVCFIITTLTIALLL